ncbi:hypothetical protein [Hydrogenophaga aquatica]
MTTVKLIAEIALMALVGRWVLGAWIQRTAPDGASGNLFLWVLDALCKPFLWLVQWITPRFVLRQHHALVAFLLLMFTWCAATVAKIVMCLDLGVQACR